MIIGNRHNGTGWVAPLKGIGFKYARTVRNFFQLNTLFLKFPNYICARLNVLLTFNTTHPLRLQEKSELPPGNY